MPPHLHRPAGDFFGGDHRSSRSGSKHRNRDASRSRYAVPNAWHAPANPARGRSASRHGAHGQTSHQTSSRPMPDFRGIFDQNPRGAARPPRATEFTARAPSRSRSARQGQRSASEARGRSHHRHSSSSDHHSSRHTRSPSRSNDALSRSESRFSRSTSVHSRSASRSSFRSGRSRNRDATSTKTRDARDLREERPVRYRARTGQVFWCENLKRVKELMRLQDAGKLPGQSMGPTAERRQFPGYSDRGPWGPIPPWYY